MHLVPVGCSPYGNAVAKKESFMKYLYGLEDQLNGTGCTAGREWHRMHWYTNGMHKTEYIAWDVKAQIVISIKNFGHTQLINLQSCTSLWNSQSNFLPLLF